MPCFSVPQPGHLTQLSAVVCSELTALLARGQGIGLQTMVEGGAAFDTLSGFLEPCIDELKSSVAAVLLATTTAVLTYMALVRSSSWMSTPGFNLLRSKPPGDGKAGSNWVKTAAAAAPHKDGAGFQGIGSGEVAVTWLGGRELQVLEAIGDTLLPGFEIATKEACTATVEQVRFT